MKSMNRMNPKGQFKNKNPIIGLSQCVDLSFDNLNVTNKKAKERDSIHLKYLMYINNIL